MQVGDAIAYGIAPLPHYGLIRVSRLSPGFGVAIAYGIAALYDIAG